MTSRIIKVDPFDLVVFGGTGDLAHRKLFPALFHRDNDEQFTEQTKIIGVSRRPLSSEEYRATVKDALMKFGGVKDGSEAVVERFLKRIEYVSVDATGDAGCDELKAQLDGEGNEGAFYLSP